MRRRYGWMGGLLVGLVGWRCADQRSDLGDLAFVCVLAYRARGRAGGVQRPLSWPFSRLGFSSSSPDRYHFFFSCFFSAAGLGCGGQERAVGSIKLIMMIMNEDLD